jgi:CBS domain containing-hemolysin-like protein
MLGFIDKKIFFCYNEEKMVYPMYNLFIILILILLNGIFSLSEMAIMTSKRIRLQQLIDTGSENAIKVLALKDNPNNFLTVVQIILNIVAILAGVFGESSLSEELTHLMTIYNVSDNISHGVAFVISLICIASIFIIFAELIPKRIALINPEKIACSIVSFLLFSIKVLSPLILSLNFISELFFKALNINTNVKEVITTEDIQAIVEAGQAGGALVREEQVLIENVFSLDNTTVRNVMTHKQDIFYIDINDTQDDIKQKIIEKPKSRFIVCDTELDNVLGYIDSTKFFKNFLEGKPMTFNRERLKESGLKQVLLIPGSITLLELLEKFKEAKDDIALVLNEYGNVTGLVTMKDIIGTVMGHVAIEDEDEQLIIKRDDSSWLIDGKTPINDVKYLLNWDDLPDESAYETISGFLMFIMKKVPKKAESIEFRDVKFEIVDTDKYRIDEVMVTIKK